MVGPAARGTGEMSPRKLAVLTGDLVASTRMPAPLRDGAFEALGGAARRIAAWQGTGDAGRFARFRGDGWQMVLADASLSLRACLFLRASLRTLDRRLDSRISIGVGRATLPEEGGLAAAGGPSL
jgi:class 3 adenylate cyclase